MFKYFVVIAVALAAVSSSVPAVVPYSSPLGATLLPKINVAPAKVTIVKQPVTIQQTETVYRSVPVPVRAVAYTAPQVITPIVHNTVIAAPHLHQPIVAARHVLY